MVIRYSKLNVQEYILLSKVGKLIMNVSPNTMQTQVRFFNDSSTTNIIFPQYYAS